MFFKLKTIKGETQTLYSAIDTYTVEWEQKYGEYSYATRKAFQAFLDKDDADKFVESLKTAFELIGAYGTSTIKLYRNNSGLKEDK